MSRFNIVNIPMISNTCCMEMLLKTTNFYDYFHSTDLHNIYQKLPKKTEKSISNLWIPPSKLSIKEELFLKNTLEIKGSNPEKLPILTESKTETQEPDHDEDWWSDELHPKIKEMFAFIKSKCADSPIRAYERPESMFINIEVLDDITNLKIIYANYLRGEMRSTLGKLLNLYKFNKKEKINRADPFVILLESLYDIDGIQPIFNRIGKELPKLCDYILYDSESHSVNNIMWYSYQLCQFFMKALWIAATAATNEDMPTEITVEALTYRINISTGPFYVTKVGQIINLLLVNLDAYVTMNYFDISSLKKEVELLREKRKEEIMAGYSADDEQRNLQKILKVMGLNIMGQGPAAAVAAAAEADDLNEGAAEAPAPLVDVVEAEYGNYVEAVGENADGDIEYDGYD